MNLAIKQNRGAEMSLEIMTQRRMELRLTQKELAQLAGIPRTVVNNIELGRSRGRHDAIERIANVLGVTAREIRDAQDRLEEENALEMTRQNNAVLMRNFKPGKLYRIWGRQPTLGASKLTWNYLAMQAARETLRFISRAGQHNVFQHPLGGWQTTYTDAQLVGMRITEG